MRFEFDAFAPRLRWCTAALLTALVLSAPVRTAAQLPGLPKAPAPDPQAAKTDTLGRDTPRGTLLRFMDVARQGNKDDAAALYLNTKRNERDAAVLAHQLFVVLDRRLPARLAELSDRPEGSLANPLKPNQDFVATIDTADGPLDILVERVSRPPLGQLWLFSSRTLDAIPRVYEESDLVNVDRSLPAVLTKPQIAGIRLFEILGVLLVLPLGYRLIGLVDTGLVRAYARIRRIPPAPRRFPDLLFGPVRLLLLAFGARWTVSKLDLSFSERRFWSTIEAVLVIVGVVWLLLRLNGIIERRIHRRMADWRVEVPPVLRFIRRVADLVFVAGGALTLLHYFGVDPTAALAGLGIGGIAVALAAQKTLENVIGGLSIIFDKVVRVGDTLKFGNTIGTVDSVGLRSTRIRTLDRTLLSVPNGQIANVDIESLSARDKFWLHHFIALRYATTAAQIRMVIETVREMLAAHPAVDPVTIRVRFLRLGAFSLDVEVSAYIVTDTWETFLETQQDMLLRIMEIVEEAGTSIALPSQTLQIAEAPASGHPASRSDEGQLGSPAGRALAGGRSIRVP